MNRLLRAMWLRIFIRPTPILTTEDLQRHGLHLIAFRWAKEGKVAFLTSKNQPVKQVVARVLEVGHLRRMRQQYPEYTLEELCQVMVFSRVHHEAQQRLLAEVAAGRRRPHVRLLWQWVGWLMRKFNL